MKDRCARIKLSNCYDLLNNYVLDTQIEQNRYDELELAQRHLKNIVPIRKGRKFNRNVNTKNNYHLNKRKSF